MPVWTPTVAVDWAGDGTFTGPYDDVTRDTAADPGLVLDAGRDGARSLNPPKVPSLDFALRNDTARYSHENPNSPVYQLVTPGTPVQASVRWGRADRYTAHTPYTEHDLYDGTTALVFGAARVDEVSQTTGWGRQQVALHCLGQSSTLIGRAVTIALQTNIRTDQAVALVLDAVGWPASKRAISPGDTTLLYWWADERSAWELLVELLASEGPGQLYEDAFGTMHFEGRNYRAVTPRASTSQASFNDVGTYSRRSAYDEHDPYTARDTYDGRSSGLYFTSLEYAPGWKSLIARATYATRRRQLGALVVVWQAGAPITLGANQSTTIFARPQDPFQNAVTPVAGTDYQVTAGAVTVAMTASSGFLAILTLTAGAAGATIAGPAASPALGLQLRAQPLTTLSETVVASTIDPASSASAYGAVQTLAVAGWPEIDPAGATAVCDAWVSRYRVQRPQVTVTVEAGDVRHLEQILERTVSDRITVTERNTGLVGADVWIESRHVEIVGAGGRHVRAVWGCELCDAIVGDTWDAATTVWGPADGNAHWGR
jgi:hypothetical protein